MPSKADERAERVALLSLVFRRIARKDAGDYRCFSTALKVVKIADRIAAAAVRFCNGELDENAYSRRQSSAKKKLRELVDAADGLGVTRIDWITGGDPRGHCLKFKHPEVMGNTWGGSGLGDAYGV